VKKIILLVITLLIFSIGALAEDNYRCKQYKVCHEDFNGCKTQNLPLKYVSLLIDEDSIPKKFVYDGIELRSLKAKSPYNEIRSLKFNEYRISHEIIKPFGNNKETFYTVFDKVSLILKSVSSYTEEDGIERVYLRNEYLCTKLN
tara:strand:+ start:79 stop:513 length:435 start_codon:yes stop_codon:yes gene_type:complete